jgi:hypothetical protein
MRINDIAIAFLRYIFHRLLTLVLEIVERNVNENKKATADSIVLFIESEGNFFNTEHPDFRRFNAYLQGRADLEDGEIQDDVTEESRFSLPVHPNAQANIFIKMVEVGRN